MDILILNPLSIYSENVVRDILYGCWCKGKRIAGVEFPNLDLLRIYTILKEMKNNVKIIDAPKEKMDKCSLVSAVKDFMPELVIASTSTMSFREDCSILREIKDTTDCKTILFGSHVTFFPEAALMDDATDFIIKNEPEFTIKRLVKLLSEKKDHSKLKGIGFKKSNKGIVNKDGRFDEDLDELPIPDRTPIINFVYFNSLIKKTPWTTMITSRGCLHDCNFCTSKRFYGYSYRANSSQWVIKEIKYLIGLGYKEIFFRDENFTTDKKRVKEICRLIIKENLKISWICSARVDAIDEKLLILMRKAGCHMIRFGVESGSQQILDNIKKGVSLKKIEEAFKLCHEHNIDTHAHLMVGCPGENWGTVNATIDFIKKLSPTTITCGAYTPIPGTEVFDSLKEKCPDIKDGTDLSIKFLHETGYFNSYFCELSDEEVGKAVKKVYVRFYLRPNYFIKTLLRLNSFNEFRRVVLSAANILSFIFNSIKKQ